MNPQLPLANINGELMPLSEVRISPLDRGFLFGDAIYEVMRIYSGQAFFEDDHFRRLERSLGEIRLTGVDLPRLRARMHETIKKSGVHEATVYIQVTRGAAPRKHAFPTNASPLELMWVQDLIDPYVKGREQGIRVVSQLDLRWKRCDIKTTNLLANVLAMQAAVEADCTEALLYGADGMLTEGTHSNLFAIVGGKLRTVATTDNILPGCTRDLVLRLAAQVGLTVEQGGFHRERLHEVSEVFMSGTTSEVLPVVRIDRTAIGGDVPGPVTRQLQALYSEVVEKFRAS